MGWVGGRGGNEGEGKIGAWKMGGKGKEIHTRQ